MDDAKAAELIKILIQQKTTLIPAFTQKAPGLPTGWSRVRTASQAAVCRSVPDGLLSRAPCTGDSVELPGSAGPSAGRGGGQTARVQERTAFPPDVRRSRRPCADWHGRW